MSPQEKEADRRPAPGRRLIFNTSLNLLGQGLPLIGAAVSIPVLIHVLGTARFGVLTLAWVLVGSFNLFDFGLGRAVTHRTAVLLALDRRSDLRGAIWTGVLAVLALGVLAGALFAILTPLAADRILNAPPALHSEIAASFFLLAAALPFVISTTALRGVLEAQGRFGMVNAIRAPTGIFTFIGPLLILPVAPTLPAVITVLAVARVIAWGAHLALCLRTVPELRIGVAFDRVELASLARFGGWLTISGVMAPLLLYLDRFVIAALLSSTAVAWYATPFDAVTKLLLVAVSLGTVLFPAFSTPLEEDAPERWQLFHRSVRFLVAAMFPLSCLLILFADPILKLWVGEQFSTHSTMVLQLLTIGVFLNSLATVPYTLIQAGGRPDLTAKLHIAELIPYLTVLYALAVGLGLNGAALAWLARVMVDCAALMWLTRKVVGYEHRAMREVVALTVMPTLVLGAAILTPPSARLIVAGCVLSGLVYAGWRGHLKSRWLSWRLTAKRTEA